MRDSFIFYNSFVEALDELPPDIQLEVYQAISHYALYGEEPNLKGIAKAVFSLIRPQIDANNKRYSDGCRGGRPKKDNEITSGFENKKPLVIKNDDFQKPNENENENENVNVNVNENVEVVEEEIEKQKNLNNYYGSYKNVFLTKKQYDTLYACILDKVILEKLINELSEAIARGKNNCKPYDAKYPDKHFADLKAFWRFSKEHPEKFMRKDVDSGGNNSDYDKVIAYIKARKEKEQHENEHV